QPAVAFGDVVAGGAKRRHSGLDETGRGSTPCRGTADHIDDFLDMNEVSLLAVIGHDLATARKRRRRLARRRAVGGCHSPARSLAIGSLRPWGLGRDTDDTKCPDHDTWMTQPGATKSASTGTTTF